MNEFDVWFPVNEKESVDEIVEGALSLPVEEILANQPDTQPDGIKGVWVADVEPEEVDWLWFPYIPFGKLTIIEGDPGVGKSWITTAIASAVSAGNPLPGQDGSPPAKVMMFSAEDGIGDTIRPRLDSLGADVERVWAAKEPITFDEGGLERLDAQIADVKPDVVFIDPLVAYMGPKLDFFKANETRAMLAPLALVAETYRCSIVVVRHLTKSRAKSIYRGQGSVDILAAARSVLLAGVVPSYDTPVEEEQRALVHIKSNLAPTGDPIGYLLREGRLEWTEESDVTADDLLGTAEETSQLDSAVDWLRSYLRERGPAPSTEVEESALIRRISASTLRRAKKQLNIQARKQTGEEHGSWWWFLPGQELDSGEPDDSDFTSLFGTD